jgi:RHS repeat-associated protein
LKRYRFTGKERDEETGLDYFGVRYYASWLGRWTSGDPGGFVDGLNLYRYTRNNPVNGVDAEGYSTEPVEPNEEQKDNSTPDGGGGNAATGELEATIYFQFDTDLRGLSIEEQRAYIANFRTNVVQFWSQQSIGGIPVDLSNVRFLHVNDGGYNRSDRTHNLFTVGNGANDPQNGNGLDQSQTSYVNHDRSTGYMYYMGGNTSSYASHEFGHIFGLADRYHTGVSANSTDASIPRPVDQDDVRVESWLTGRLTVPMILNNRIDPGYDPFDNFYSGSGTSLTPMQMGIVFSINNNEKSYPTGIFIHQGRSALRYDAIHLKNTLGKPIPHIRPSGNDARTSIRQRNLSISFVQHIHIPVVKKSILLYNNKLAKNRVVNTIFNMTKAEKNRNKEYIKLRLGHAH